MIEIKVKSLQEIQIMKTGGHLLSEVALELKEMISPGITTKDLEEKSYREFERKGLKPAFLNYGKPPYPSIICTSVNHEIVHGIPSENKSLKDGDIISIDIGAIWEGYYVDMAFTQGVGRFGKLQKDLIRTTKKALKIGTQKMNKNNKLHDISAAIQNVAEKKGYNVVRDLVGHGIGKKLHESPQIPNYGMKNTGIQLKPGMVFAIEPMVNVGTYEIKVLEDEWTVVTADGKLSCHFENTIAIMKNGPMKLTESTW